MATATLVAAAGGAGAVAWYLRERSLRRTHAVGAGLQADVALPHTDEFELYHNDFSLCSKKVRLCLAELGIRYRAHHIDLIETGSYETLSRAFLAVNPGAFVPVLVHRGHPVYESHEIIAYAAAQAEAAARLVPDDPALALRMQTWIHKSSVLGDRPVDDLETSAGNCIPGLTVPLFAAMIPDIAVRRITEGLLFHRLKVRPLLFLALKLAGLRRLGALRPAVALIRASRRWMDRHLDDLETELERSGGPWILGRAFTLADVSWAVVLDRLLEADWETTFLGPQRPRVTCYWEDLRKRPSARAALDRFRHPTVARGTARIVAERRRNAAFDTAVYGAGEAPATA